jgi:hypothetical protein
MSSWVSHFTRRPERLTVLGMNIEELAANPQASATVVHDLKRRSFAAVRRRVVRRCVCCVSVDYLVHPVAVFSDVARVVRPEGLFVCTFSNRCFPTKAIAGWLYANDAQRCAIVADYFRQAGGWSEPTVDQRTPAHHFGDPCMRCGRHVRDPFTDAGEPSRRRLRIP